MADRKKPKSQWLQGLMQLEAVGSLEIPRRIDEIDFVCAHTFDTIARG